MAKKGTVDILDPALDNSRRTLATRLEGPDKDRISIEWLLGREDGVEFGVDGAKQLGIAICDSIGIVLYPTGEPVESHRANGAVWSDNNSTDFGPEIWSLYQAGLLTNDTPLTGQFAHSTAAVDVGGVLREIDDARAEDAARRLRMAAPV